LLGVIAFFILPELLGGLKEYRMIVYGLGLVAFAVFLPGGIAGGIETLWRKWGWQLSADRLPSTPRMNPIIRSAAAEPTGASLEIIRVSKSFGGVHALNEVNISVPAGHIHAIVGPNGSGKTTLLNVISGLYPTSGGSVRLGNKELTALAPHRIARLGVRRTFQTPKLLDSISALDNVTFGAYDRESSTGIEVALSLPRARREQAELKEEARDLLNLVGLENQSSVRGEQLPHGRQRLLEIARALVSRPRLLLLDEPAAGLSLGELERLQELMIQVRRRGVTVVMVEHHIEVVMGVAQAVTVLDQGEVLASGSPEEVFRNRNVIEAYTGERR
jgi:ABC-type branched-subunit amino acid transport system ATPase component